MCLCCDESRNFNPRARTGRDLLLLRARLQKFINITYIEKIIFCKNGSKIS
jgi:hypothetical protein